MSKGTIICLCDITGVMAKPWVEAGYRAFWLTRSTLILQSTVLLSAYRQPSLRRCLGYLRLSALRTS